jgi:hypothetical protein
MGPRQLNAGVLVRPLQYRRSTGALLCLRTRGLVHQKTLNRLIRFVERFRQLRSW